MKVLISGKEASLWIWRIVSRAKALIFLAILLYGLTAIQMEHRLQPHSAGVGPGTTAGILHRPRLSTKVMRILHWTTNYKRSDVVKDHMITCGDSVCHITADKDYLKLSHALIFHGWREDMLAKYVGNVNGTNIWKPINIPEIRFGDQYWIFHMMEPPVNFVQGIQSYSGLFNWTMTYRTDSDIFFPYGKFEKRLHPDDKQIHPGRLLPTTKNKLVAQVNSKCGNDTSKRELLLGALQKHIPVDVYGKCGVFNCTRPTRYNCKKDLGKIYKFYLSFENSVCQDYITEKLFEAYAARMVPVVYGGANYGQFVPRGSYINVESFPGAKALADYLLYLDKHDEEYLKYFEWRKYYRVVYQKDFPESYCKLCTKLHEDYPKGRISEYRNMTDWIRANNGKYPVCNTPLVW